MRHRSFLPALLVAGLLALAVSALGAPTASANGTQESVFQDDAYLIYQPPAVVDQTLARLESLGVQRIRVTLKWSAIAPAPTSTKMPRHFNALDPGAYPRGIWSPYDRLVLLGGRHHIRVEFNLTAPGPLWAMAGGSPTARAADHWQPSAAAFYKFVHAVGARYSGSYGTVPRVNFWTIWNEPNQPGWLAPQWRSYHGHEVANSPRLYRQQVDAAMSALAATGHTPARDTMLIGELAPEGYSAKAALVAMTPLPFIRSLYCLDSSHRPLRGDAAAGLGCPTSGSRSAFVKAHPGLFNATGFAHHPYYFLHAPWVSATDSNFAPLANLGRLERGLDRALAANGVHRHLPIYLTEYGYQTAPPDPYVNVPLAAQALYLNAADYLAWRDPRVRSVAQFLLYDSGPDPRYKPSDFGYWDTFQTGLLFASGATKPAYGAYRMPIWVPTTSVRRGRSMFVWGQLRAAIHAPAGQRAAVQWRGAHGGYHTLTRVTTNRFGYFTVRPTPPGTGYLRIAWQPPRGNVLLSRSVPITVR